MVSQETGSIHVEVRKYLSLGQLRLDGWPGLALSSITEQIHNDRASRNSFINIEQVFAWDPAVLLGLFP
jgi:hypothetical protein